VAFSELQKTMANLRLSLSEINNKERQLDAMVSQFRTQMRRLPRQVIYGRTNLDASLAAMGEIEERLADAVARRRHLLAIKKSAAQELEALEVVKRVDETRRSLRELRQRINEFGEDEESLAEIRQLEQFITEHSKRAEWAITANHQEQPEI
jgi:chemotaxis regulatin CheY-phosphate phosphatase CheZ